jgi:pimeloyl-ACP methyl ester carboxylesterase
MGDLRAAYRFLAPALRETGYRVACTDLRGHGDSDATFSSYGDEETADDDDALITEFGGPAVVIGNSMAAGSAVLAAARQPGLVSGLVLAGPFVRNPAAGAMHHLALRLAMARRGRPHRGSPICRSCTQVSGPQTSSSRNGLCWSQPGGPVREGI